VVLSPFLIAVIFVKQELRRLGRFTMLEFKTEIRQVPTIEEVLTRLYAVMRPMVDPDGEFAAANIPLIVCPEVVSEEDYFEEGRQFSFYIPYVSTRPVLAWREGESIIVRARTLLSPIDFSLALQIVKAMRQFGATSIVTDDEPDSPVGFDFLEKKFSPSFYMDWARASMREMMSTCSIDENALFVMHGPFQEFRFGSLLNAVFACMPDEEQRLHRLHDMMRELNYWHLSDETRDQPVAGTSESEDGTTIAYIELYKQVVVPKADHYCFFKENNLVYMMRRDEFYDRFPPGHQFELMDEYQCRVHVSEDDVAWLMNGDVVDLSAV